MSKEHIPTGKAPHIFLDSCDGDLVIRGRPEPALQVKGEFEVTESDKGYHLTGHGGLTLIAPADAILTIGDVGGDLVVKHVAGFCHVDQVHGDVALTDLGQVELGVVNGDVSARHLRGSLAVDQTHGDAQVRNAAAVTLGTVHSDLVARHLSGALTVGEVSGDADLRHVDGDVVLSCGHRDVNLTNVNGIVTVTDVHGDIRLRGRLGQGDHSLQAQGDVVVRWPAGAPLNVTATGARIDNRLPLEDAVAKNGGSLVGRLGQGETHLMINAGGRVVLREVEMVDEKWGDFGGAEAGFDFEIDMGPMSMGNIGARVEAEVNQHIARVTQDLGAKFGANFGQRIAEQVARKAEKAAERAERAAERARRRSGDARGRAGVFDFTAPPAPPKPASMEEQLKILKMVETGKITPEEANMLLEALGS